MMRRDWMALFLFLASFSLVHADGVSLQLGEDIISPGNIALVNLRLIPADQKIIRVVATVTYPGDKIVFKEAKKSLVSETAKAEVRAEAADAKQASAQLKLELKGAQPFAEGILTELNFDIPAETSLQTVSLGLKAEAYDQSGKSVPVSVQGGKIEIIEAPPISACFFYMH